MNETITNHPPADLSSALRGCLVGTAVGDALGLPAEGLSPQRQARLFGTIDRHRFVLGRGMVSDDTEHTLMVAQAITVSAGEPEAFARALAHQMRIWFAMIPAGVGLATLRACLKLSVGVPPTRSGVFSAGNGPAMRAALLGVCFGDDPARLRALVRASSRMTHTDPRAEQGALAVALAAHLAASGTLDTLTFSSRWHDLTADTEGGIDGELQHGVAAACQSATEGNMQDTPAFAASLGLANGVSGYVCHTVPVALHAALRHPADFRAAIAGAIACGGDTDSVAAIVGGIVGAGVGTAGIPAAWRDGLAEWPRSIRWMEELAEKRRHGGRIPQQIARRKRSLSCLPAVALRNLFFLAVVLFHGARRLLPPY